MSPLRKNSKFDNQPFFTLHPKGKRLIINEVGGIVFSTLKLIDFSEWAQ